MDVGTILIWTACFIGCLWIMWNLIIPLADAVVFSIGYTIFNVIHLSFTKIIRRPHLYVWFVVKSFLKGIVKRTCDIGTLELSKTSKWIWKPYFHYEKIGDDNE